MWKVVDGFVTGHSKHREIVSAVLSGEDDRYTVDGRHMNVRVPDMLLRTCEREIQRVGIRCTRVNEIWIPGLEFAENLPTILCCSKCVRENTLN